jgi:hypothetical protein
MKWRAQLGGPSLNKLTGHPAQRRLKPNRREDRYRRIGMQICDLFSGKGVSWKDFALATARLPF